MRTIVLLLILSTISTFSLSQETTSKYDTLRNDALNVYLSTSGSGNSAINSDYFRQEVTFINYVRDLKVADVFIITASQSNGSGGNTFTYFIVGQNSFSGMNDTIKVNSSRDDTQDIIRIKQINALKMSLMRYVLKTPLAEYFDIRFTKPVKETITTDKWDSWVFRTNLNGSLNGQKRFKSIGLQGNATANRITEKSKLLTNLGFYWSTERYELNDSTFENTLYRSQNSNILYVLSINNHWSAGISSGFSTSIFGSYDFKYNIAPAIEYDIFPYSESTRRQLRILYRVGYEYYDYSDTTIYNKLTQNLGFHSLTASFEFIQKWGSADFTLSYRNYFFDWKKNNIQGNLYLSLRIAKGLSLTFQGNASIVNDQLSLPKGGVSDTDILLRRKMTETKYSYYAYFGISYTFGSIYNNVVNPRLN
jgi:hypothetical protein